MDSQRSDFSTGLGIFLAFGIVLYAISLESSLVAYLDLPAFMIVVLGTLAITTACYSLQEIIRTQGLVARTLFSGATMPSEAAREILDLAEQARKNGLLGLQSVMNNTGTPRFLRKALGLAIDGVELEVAETSLRQEISSMMERHARSASILRKSAETAPAMGLIGTLIGLVQMLGNLEDPAKIGPAMAVALLATLYGALLSYVIFSPLASKLERNSKQEAMINMLYARGVLSIARKENPRRTQMILNAILAPGERVFNFG